jgi:hypothetical protein
LPHMIIDPSIVFNREHVLIDNIIIKNWNNIEISD